MESKKSKNIEKVKYRKTGAFVLGVIFALLSIAAAVAHFKLVLPIADATATPLILSVLAGIAFLLLGFIGAPTYGAAAMAILDFSALLVLLKDLAVYVINLVNSYAMSNYTDISDIYKIGAVAAAFMICAAFSGILSWCKMKKLSTDNKGGNK